MLKRNKVLVAFMLVAVLCMSIGFAAISDTLTATSSFALAADANSNLGKTFDADVYFSDVSRVVSSKVDSEVTATIRENNKDEIDIEIGGDAFTKVGDTVVVTATIINEGDTEVTLENPDLDDTNFTTAKDYASITVGNLDATSLEKNGTATFTITVTLNAIPADSVTGGFSVSVVATPAK